MKRQFLFALITVEGQDRGNVFGRIVVVIVFRDVEHFVFKFAVPVFDGYLLIINDKTCFLVAERLTGDNEQNKEKDCNACDMTLRMTARMQKCMAENR